MAPWKEELGSLPLSRWLHLSHQTRLHFAKRRRTPPDEHDAAEQDHWTERGPATAVGNSDVTGRPRRSVLTFTSQALVRVSVMRPQMTAATVIMSSQSL